MAQIVPVLIATVVTTAISYIVQASLPKPKGPKSLATSTSLDNLRNVVQSNTAPARVIYGTTRVSGVLFFAQSVTPTGKSSSGAFTDGIDLNASVLHICLGLSEGPIAAIRDMQLNDIEATDSRYRGLVGFFPMLGGPDQEPFSGLITVTNAPLQAPEDWTKLNRALRGIAYAWVVMRYDQGAFPSGAPNIRFTVDGRLLYDPRDPNQDPNDWRTHTFSNNWALCVFDYLRSPLYGMGLKLREINIDSVIAAANISDQLVAIPSTLDAAPDSPKRTQKRYTCNGVFETSAPCTEILAELNAAAAADVLHSNGQFYLRPGARRAPTFSFGPDDIRADQIALSPKQGRASTINGVRGTYISADKNWQEDDFPPVQVPEFVRDDGGIELWSDVNFSFVDNPYQAQRLALIMLRQARYAETITLPLQLTALKAQSRDVGTVSLPYFGWNDKMMRIDDFTLDPVRGIDLVMRAYADDIYDWREDFAKLHEPPIDTTLPPPFAIAPPSLVTASELLSVLPDGKRGAVIALTIGPPSARVAVDYYRIRYIHEDDPPENMQQRTTTATYVELTGVRAGTWLIEVVVVNLSGQISSPVRVRCNVTYLTLPPPNVVHLLAERAGGGWHFSWELETSLPLDLKGYYLRWQQGALGADLNAAWDAAAATNIWIGHSEWLEMRRFQAPGVYSLMIKSVDWTLLESDSIAFVTFETPLPERGELIYVDEARRGNWPGTLFNGRIAASGAIIAKSGDKWGDSPWSVSWATCTRWSTKSAALTYTHPAIDLGADYAIAPQIMPAGLGTLIVEVLVIKNDGTRTGWSQAPQQIGRYVSVRVRTEPEPGVVLIDLLRIAIARVSEVEFVNDYDSSQNAHDVVSIARREDAQSTFNRGLHIGTVSRAEGLGIVAFAAVEFTADNQYATASDAPQLRLGGSFTIEAIIRPEGASQTDAYIVAKGTDFVMRLQGSTLSLYAVDAGAAQLSVTATIDCWAMSAIAIVVDNQQVRLYVNGVQQGRTTKIGAWAFKQSTAALTIGGISGHWYRGVVRNVRIWKTARTLDEIEAGMEGNVEDDPNLVAYYRLDEQSGTIVGDVSRFDNDATLVGSPLRVREGMRVSPPMDLSPIASQSGAPTVSALALLPTGTNIVVQASVDNSAWVTLLSLTSSNNAVATVAANTAPFLATSDRAGQTLYLRARLRSTDLASSPTLQNLIAAFSTRVPKGELIYIPQKRFAWLDSATLSALQNSVARSAILVARTPYGVRWHLRDAADKPADALVDFELHGPPLVG